VAPSRPDQLLVAVSPSPHSAKLLRAARRMAGSLHARWFAVYVEPRSGRALSKADAQRLRQNLGLAERLGARVVTLTGDTPTEEILRFARARNITKLIIGKPLPGRLWEKLRPSVVDQIVRQSGDIDVYVTAGAPDASSNRVEEQSASSPLQLPAYAWAAAAPVLATAVSLSLFGRDQLPDVVMVYLLGIMLVASRLAFGPAIFAAFLSVAAFDFFFVPPYLTFVFADFKHATTFIVMFVVAVVVSGLTQRVRNQALAAQERELRTAALYALSHELAAAQGLEKVIRTAASQLESTFRSGISVWLPDAGGTLARRYASAGLGPSSDLELSVCEWVWANQRQAGLGTTTLPGVPTLCSPLIGSTGIVGVLGLTPATKESERLSHHAQLRQLDAFVSQMALAVERAKLAEEAETARREMETEQLRSALLSSVSHDLRTPLAVITGASSTLLQSGPMVNESTRQDLLCTVLEEAERLNRLIGNVLDMTRLESGAVKVHKEWLSLEELVGGALERLDARLGAREVRVQLPRDLPLVPGDAVLLEQVLINLLENAIKYSSGALEIRAEATTEQVQVEVSDRGGGIQPGEEERIFDKFQRSERAGAREGVGLGLTICRAIATAHGGKIWGANRDGGGASFIFTLPLAGSPLHLPPVETLDSTLEEPPA
jgi:two-component system sensor histidine kinase KdpD